MKNTKRKKKVETPIVQEVKPEILEENIIEKEESKVQIEKEPDSPKHSEDKSGKFKLLAVVVLLAVVLFMAYYFLNPQFIPANVITQDEFKDVFSSAEIVYIVMDVRQISDPIISNGVLQCGVDFAASNGMGGKNVTPLSISADGCITQFGAKPTNECISMLKDGITIYIKSGSDQTKYYSNSMVVSISGNYTYGTCGIKVAK